MLSFHFFSPQTHYGGLLPRCELLMSPERFCQCCNAAIMNNPHSEAAVDKYVHFQFILPTRECKGIWAVAIATWRPAAKKFSRPW